VQKTRTTGAIRHVYLLHKKKRREEEEEEVELVGEETVMGVLV